MEGRNGRGRRWLQGRLRKVGRDVSVCEVWYADVYLWRSKVVVVIWGFMYCALYSCIA